MRIIAFISSRSKRGAERATSNSVSDFLGPVVLLLILLPLTGCISAVGLGAIGAEGAVMYATKPGDPPPADHANDIPAHESWCYRTMGDVECFAKAQREALPESLINVDPQNRYPLTAQEYRDEVAGKRHVSPATDEPVALNNGIAVLPPIAPVAVHKAVSTEKVSKMATKKKAPAKKTTAKKTTAKKKTVKKATKCKGCCKKK